MLEMLEKLKLKVDKQLQKNRSLSPFRPSGQLRVLDWGEYLNIHRKGRRKYFQYLGNVEYWRRMMNNIG